MKGKQDALHSKRGWLIYAICLLCAVLIKPVQDRFEAILGEPEPDPDLLYFSSPAGVKRMALGYDALFADFYWMRSIQYYGRTDRADIRPIRYKNLSALLDITTTLDPYLLDAYRVGSDFLAEPDPIGAGRPDEALKLLERGIRVHPADWRLLYDKGFIYYWFLEDYRSAGEVWLAGSKLPSAPFWMPSLAAASMSKGGAVDIAIALWKRQYEESNREDVRENARNHLLSFQVTEELLALDALTEKFRERTGSYPRSLPELLAGERYKRPIIDPLGTPYEYDPQTGIARLSPDTKIRYLNVSESYKQQLRLMIAASINSSTGPAQ